MKKLLMVVLCFWVLSCVSIIGQQDPFITDYLERFDNSHKYLITVAESMPEAHYNFKASPESLSFAEHFLHIGYAMDWHAQSLLGNRAARDWNTDNTYKTEGKTKKEMILLLNRTFEATKTLMQHFIAGELEVELDYFGLKRSKRQIFLLLADHISHHRGQMLVMLRLNGLVPPRYVLYQ